MVQLIQLPELHLMSSLEFGSLFALGLGHSDQMFTSWTRHCEEYKRWTNRGITRVGSNSCSTVVTGLSSARRRDFVHINK